jgi:hypothetical protein
MTHANMHIEYYSAQERAWHDVHAILWTPEFAVAGTMDLAPITVVPVAFMAEYGFRATHVSRGDWNKAFQEIALGAYYSGRPDLQVGAAFDYIFTFDTTVGLDATGRPYPSGTPSAIGGRITLRYTW